MNFDKNSMVIFLKRFYPESFFILKSIYFFRFHDVSMSDLRQEYEDYIFDYFRFNRTDALEFNDIIKIMVDNEIIIKTANLQFYIPIKSLEIFKRIMHDL